MDKLKIIISTPYLHARWLNTLSYLENCGARKISRCEHPMLVREEMLKHAAEEFRHAYYLKQQIRKITTENFETYELDKLLGGMTTKHYLDTLDIAACRFLKNVSKDQFRRLAYLTVTYAIEVRASALYPLYELMLRTYQSPIKVKSIILEEDEHLHEMQQELATIPQGLYYSENICRIESQLYKKWQNSIANSIMTAN